MTALKLGHPTTFEASFSVYVAEFTWDKKITFEGYPQASIVRYQFPGREGTPPVSVTWYDGGLLPERPAELAEGRRMGNEMGGTIFKGSKGKLICESHSGAPRLIPDSFMRSYKQPPKSVPRVESHRQEWIQACRTIGIASSNFEYAGLLTEVALLGNVALRAGFGKKYQWDPFICGFC